MPKQLLNNSKKLTKVLKIDLFDPENGQTNPLRGPNFDKNYDFRGHISTFEAENRPKS